MNQTLQRKAAAAQDEEAAGPALEPDHGAPSRSMAAIGRETGDAAATRAAPLPDEVRASVERASGVDLSDVRVRVGPEAAAIGADAFTRGNEIVFAPGRFTPDSGEGRRLIGHELWHVVQQRQGRVAPTTSAKGAPVNDDAALEAEADRMGASAVDGASKDKDADAVKPMPTEPTKGAAESSAAPVQMKVTVNPVAAEHDDAATLHGKTLDQFRDHITKQLDWSRKLVDADAEALRGLIKRVLAKPAIATACGAYTVKDLLAIADWKPVEKYAQGVESPRDPPTARLEIEPTLGEATKLGETVLKLEAACGGTCLYHISSYAAIKALMAHNFVDAFVQYVTSQKPLLHAERSEDPAGNDELLSYIKTKVMGADPLTLAGKLPRIRNIHRFQALALHTLAANFADVSKKRPVTLILHSSLDHNAAFHQDPNLTAVIINGGFNSLMIEGAADLGSVTAEIGPIAKTYGPGDKVAQVMIAGHGGPRGIELAGTVSEQKPTKAGDTPTMQEHYDSVELDDPAQAAKADALFDEILKNLDSSASGRVVFNACLTGSTDVNVDTSSPDSPEKQIQETLKNKPNLTEYLRRRASAQGVAADVRGANGSFGQVELQDATGKLDIVDPGDPALTSSKADYIEFGTEPEGVMRAVLELWEDPTGKATKPEWLTRVEKRLASPVAGWEHTEILTFFKLIKSSYAADPAGIQTFIGIAHPISALQLESEALPGNLGDLLFHADAIAILTGMSADPKYKKFAKLALLQVWAQLDATKRADLVAHLGTMKVDKAEPHVDTAALGDGALRAMLGKTKTPTDGQLVLAFIDRFTTPHKASEDFLLEIIDGNDFLAGLKPQISNVLGNRGLDTALATVGRGPFAASGSAPAKKGPRTEDGNLDLDNDDTNESFADPVQRPGKVANCYVLRVREKPSMSAKTIDYLHVGDEVFVLGSKPGWDVIDWKGKPAFVGSAYIER